jgi:hypothetical protein
MGSEAVTVEGRCRIRKSLDWVEEGDYDGFKEALKAELGAKPVVLYEKTTEILTLPSVHANRRHIHGDRDKYVLKICPNCLDEIEHSHCRVEQESWVWHEALRRGDEKLFAPVLGFDRSAGWLVMEYCEPWETIATGNEPKGFQRRTMTAAFRKRGWVPNDLSHEIRAFDGRLVAVDYEKFVPADMVTGFYQHSFRYAPEMRYSARSIDAMDRRRRERYGRRPI